MVFPVVGGDGKPTGYEVTNSLRFDNYAGEALGGTFGTPTNNKIFTLSLWYKLCRGDVSGGQVLFGARGGLENIFLHEDTIRMDWNNANGGTINWAPFIRDESAWYNFVIAQDTSQGTAANRIKFYLNGTQITTLRAGVTGTYPSQNLASGYNVDGVAFFVSSYNGSAAEINGYLAEVAFVDGTQYAASDFGETDSNGIWIPKEFKDDITFGNNGFLLEFKQTGTGTDANGMGADTSGNTNHLAVTNLASDNQSKDVPTNSFCTWDSTTRNTGLKFFEGNLKLENIATDNHRSVLGTQAVSKGKWYYEIKCGPTGDSQGFLVGWANVNSLDQDAHLFPDNQFPARASFGFQYLSSGQSYTGGSGTSYGASWSSNTVIGCYIDLDNGTAGFMHGSDRGNAFTGMTVGDNIFYAPAATLAQASNGEDAIMDGNFGGSKIDSDFGSNTDANGHGHFAYSVPSGYLALCTENIAKSG